MHTRARLVATARARHADSAASVGSARPTWATSRRRRRRCRARLLVRSMYWSTTTNSPGFMSSRSEPTADTLTIWCGAQLLQRVDVGAVVDAMGRDAVPPAVAGQKVEARVAQCAHHDLVGGLAEGRPHVCSRSSVGPPWRTGRCRRSRRYGASSLSSLLLSLASLARGYLVASHRRACAGCAAFTVCSPRSTTSSTAPDLARQELWTCSWLSPATGCAVDRQQAIFGQRAPPGAPDLRWRNLHDPYPPGRPGQIRVNPAGPAGSATRRQDRPQGEAARQRRPRRLFRRQDRRFPPGSPRFRFRDGREGGFMGLSVRGLKRMRHDAER